jgi:hypothetical protein
MEKREKKGETIVQERGQTKACPLSCTLYRKKIGYIGSLETGDEISK